jgi:hypothetical protein
MAPDHYVIYVEHIILMAEKIVHPALQGDQVGRIFAY